MAPDRKPDPPRSVAAWLGFTQYCLKVGRPGWYDVPEIFWPEDQDWPSESGPSWVPLADDHPYKGQAFCWRCLAEAQGFTAGGFPHNSSVGTICFKAEATSGDADQDPGTAVGTVTATFELGDGTIGYIATASEAGRELLSRNALRGASVDEPDYPIGYDTGTFFYEGPTR